MDAGTYSFKYNLLCFSFAFNDSTVWLADPWANNTVKYQTIGRLTRIYLHVAHGQKEVSGYMYPKTSNLTEEKERKSRTHLHILLVICHTWILTKNWKKRLIVSIYTPRMEWWYWIRVKSCTVAIPFRPPLPSSPNARERVKSSSGIKVRLECQAILMQGVKRTSHRCISHRHCIRRTAQHGISGSDSIIAL